MTNPTQDLTATRTVVGSYGSYRDAERAMDRLADSGFPVEGTAIIGRGLHYVEEVTGRFGWGDAALRGGLTGGIVGALIGWLFGVFDWFDPLVQAVWLALDGLWFGALAGALIGLAAHALTRGRRDFAAVPVMRAERYEVVVDERLAERARAILEQAEPEARRGAAPPSRPSAAGGRA